MKVTGVVILVSISSLLGCVDQQQINREQRYRAEDVWKKSLPDVNADYGSYPKNYQEIIRSSLEKSLKDPDSAKYSDYKEPKKEYYITDPTKREVLYGYAACVSVNAKNSYGGYSGSMPFWFLIKDSKVIATLDSESAGASSQSIMLLSLESKCRR